MSHNFRFQLTNLTNDKPICFTPTIDANTIQLAIDLHGVGIEDIGITILDLEAE